jgi:hypothetical protein
MAAPWIQLVAQTQGQFFLEIKMIFSCGQKEEKQYCTETVVNLCFLLMFRAEINKPYPKVSVEDH